jgi:hypothetical protein
METGTLLILMTNTAVVLAFLRSNNKSFFHYNKKRHSVVPIKNQKEQTPAQAIKVLNNYFF